MKKFSLLFFALILSVGTIVAQRTITGSVVDNTGEALIGANILAKGTTSGTITDIDGTFSLDVPDGSTALVISFTGYETQEFDITSTSVVDVVLSEGELLDEVVVTGLGIKREKKALGYGVTTLGAESVANRAETDVARILRGKATGVNITQTSGMAGSGTNIIIRGYSSISGNNQPLFVVDGVPFNTDTNNDDGFNAGGATASSRFLDLDPNNIAEISILKGLSATVLYGEAGRNGVVLVTTKTGSTSAGNQSGTEISFSQSISFTEVANLPSYQNTYGNGFSGNFGWFFSNWGPSFDVRGSNGVAEDGTIEHPYDQEQYNGDFPEFIGQRYSYEAYESVENFFDRGATYNTSVGIEKSYGNASIAANYSYLDDGGFTPALEDGSPSNRYSKHNLSLGASANLDNGLNIRGSFNYITSDRITPPAARSTGSGANAGNTSLFGDVLYTPRSIDLLNLPYESPIDGSMVYYRRGAAIDNPLWTLNNASQAEQINRFTGNIQLGYELTENLSLSYRIGVDQYDQANDYRVNKGASQIPQGLFVSSQRKNAITDQVANLLYDFQLNDDISIDGIVGVNLRRESNDFLIDRSAEQFVFDLFTHQNFIQNTTASFVTLENTIGAYGTATFGYKNFFYVGVQARNDWTSTLEPENRSVFYPSASVSFIPSEAFDFGGSAVNYLKVRLGYGTSAGYPDPYQTQTVLNTNTRVFVAPDGTVVNSNGISNQLGNPGLQAEKITELELGVEAKFLDNRIGIDLSIYNKSSDDLIIPLALDPATGFTTTTVNAASLTNKGVELGLTITPFRGKFNWDATINYTRNRNIVDEIAPGVDQVLVDGGGFTNLGNFAIPGEPFGVIQGSAYEKNDNGDFLVNSIGEYVSTQDIQIIGDPNINYTATLINTFSWNNLALNVQIDYRDGGDIFSGTTATLLARGNTIDTDFNRFLPVVLPGVLASDGSTPNNIQVYAGDAFFSGYFGANEGSIFDGTNIRLREVSLSYAVPTSLLEGTPFGALSVRVFGENLWFRSPNFPDGVNFDPEVLSLGVGNGQGFDFLTGPTAKKYGVALNVTF